MTISVENRKTEVVVKAGFIEVDPVFPVSHPEQYKLKSNIQFY